MSFYKPNSLVDQYFQDIEASKGLPSEKERALARRIQQGDEEALQELVQANLRFVVTIAKEYQELGLPLADLISIGNLGLVVAAKRFDGDKGFRFISYAVWWIRQAILQALKDQTHLVRLPGHQMDMLARIRKSLRELEQKLGRPAELQEIAEELSLIPEEMDALLEAAQSPVFLDAPLREEAQDRCIGDLIPDASLLEVEETLSREELKAKVQRALTILTEQEARVLCLYFGLNGHEAMTLEEIGAHFGRTRERVRQIKEKALTKLRSPSASRILREFFTD